MNIDINTDKLKEEIARFESLNNSLKERRTTIFKENEDLKEYYETKTSKKINTEFDAFKLELDDYITKNDNYITYLKKVVDEGYTEFEETENELIDENIKVDWST